MQRINAARRCCKVLAILVSLVAVSTATPHLYAQSSNAAPALPPHLEEKAIRIEQSLICPVCPGETVNQSQATLAKQMRVIVRERLLQGQSEQAILDYFVSVYGSSVLAEPPAEGFGLAAWIVPPAALATGALVLFLTLRTMRSHHPPRHLAAESATDDPSLADSLHIVDQELGEEKG